MHDDPAHPTMNRNTDAIPPTRNSAPPFDQAVVNWLLLCVAMVMAMVVVGGITRLTHSGLSIVEWQPLIGTLPPLSQSDWMLLFEKYQQTPQFKLVNHAMTLPEFKGIFWWEYFHRLLGRVIGLVFVLPLLWFWWRRRIDAKLAVRLTGIFVLGGLQGVMGWYMVKSGLVDEPNVSQFRLVAHLALAFAILAGLVWTLLGILYPGRSRSAASPSWRRHAWVVTGLAAYMVVTGGFVAGIRAGLAYNTFPLMNGHFFPPESFLIEPLWRNFFWNMALVQFDHRLGAWLLAFVTPLLWFRIRRIADRRVRQAAHWLLLALVVQITLGIATVLGQVPIALAAAHQLGATLLLIAALNLNHALRD